MALTYSTNPKSQANGWLLHRITGTFLVFLLLTHFWIQHFDSTTQSVVEQVVVKGDNPQGQADALDAEGDEAAPMPTYSENATNAVNQRRTVDARFGPVGSPVTPYEVTMLRLADPVYAVLWKTFNLFFLLFALHHGFYGLNNILTDYVRRPMLRAVLGKLTWALAGVLFLIGAYSVIMAGVNMQPPSGGAPSVQQTAPVPTP